MVDELQENVQPLLRRKTMLEIAIISFGFLEIMKLGGRFLHV